MVTAIGYNSNNYWITFYFRCSRGFKYAMHVKSDVSGAKNLYMCGDIPQMSAEEYNKLPDKIDNRVAVRLPVDMTMNCPDIETDKRY